MVKIKKYAVLVENVIVFYLVKMIEIIESIKTYACTVVLVMVIQLHSRKFVSSFFKLFS